MRARIFEPPSRIELEPPVYETDARPSCYRGKSFTPRADDGDRTRLYQLGTLTPHQAASSAKSPESRFKQSGGRSTLIVSVGDRAITGRAARAPMLLVEVRGFEPPIPCSQGRCDTTSLYLDFSQNSVPPVGLGPTHFRVRTGCSNIGATGAKQRDSAQNLS